MDDQKEKMDEHRARYKNSGLSAKELRRRREEDSIQLRKQKREEALNKRRTIAPKDYDLNDDNSGPPLSVTKDIVEGLMQNESLELLIESAQKVRKILSKEPQPPIDDVIRSGFMPRLSELLLRDECSTLQFEVAWILTNVASGTSEQTKTLIDCGAAKTFIRLLNSVHPEVREQAVWALGNVAGDSSECRDYLINEGIMRPLLNILMESGQNISLVRNAVWTVSNLCRGKQQTPYFDQFKDSLPVLAKTLNHHDTEVLSDTCWALAYLCDGPNEKIQAVLDAGVARRLVELLMHESNNVVSAAIRAVGNIVTGEDHQTQIIVNCGALPYLKKLLTVRKEALRKEACWTVSNIAAGNKTQIQAVCDAGIFPDLIEIIHNCEARTRKEAAWVIANATSGGTFEQIEHIVECGAIEALCSQLTSSDSKQLQVALNALENILKAGQAQIGRPGFEEGNKYVQMAEENGMYDKVTYLQSHDNADIYKKSYELIDKYFAIEDTETNINPTFDPTQQQYSFNANSSDSGAQFNF